MSNHPAQQSLQLPTQSLPGWWSHSGFIWLTVAVLCFRMEISHAATSRDSVVNVTATTRSSAPVISLIWTDTMSSSYTMKVYRRVKGEASWVLQTTLASDVTTYADMSASPGVAYEYSLKGGARNGGIVAGYNIPLVESRGKVILLVDNTMATALAPEINQLQKNLVADGWLVYRHDVPRESIPAASYSSAVWAARIAEQKNIRSIVQADYNSAPGNDWSLFILGRIPVPYSGTRAPDGHSKHAGAQPTDIYYADVDGAWSDTTANTGTSGLDDVRNYNLIGDGKFDTDTISSPVELQCGRVDLAKMSSVPYGMDESGLLRQYLVRNNNFRRMQAPYNNVARRGIVVDGFNAYAQMGWGTGFGFFGKNSGQMDAADWFGVLPSTAMLYAYGCGSGSWTSASGVGDSIINFGMTDSKAVFNVLFGSWFGDWDRPDTLSRAPLAGTANSLGLTCVWSGSGFCDIPLYHMALGDPIGYCVREAQNKYGTTGDWSSASRYVHYGMMGDPTLRLHVVSPPSKVTATSTNSGITLTWAASSDAAIAGYHVYRSTSTVGPFIRVTGSAASSTNPTGSPLTATNFADTDAGLLAGTPYTYQVKAVKMETSASGTYANQSIGESVTVTHLAPTPVPIAPTRLAVSRTGTSTFLLNWDDNATDETAYIVERRDATTGNWSQIVSLGSNAITYTDANAPAGQIVYYRVRASNGNGNSAYSNETSDFALPGIAYATKYSYLTSKTSGSCPVSITRFNGSAGEVTSTYSAVGVLGGAGTDYPTLPGSVTWSHGEKGAKPATFSIPNPSGTQLTKIFQATCSGTTNGLSIGSQYYLSPVNGYASFLNPYVLIYDTTAQTLPSPWATTTFGSVVSGGEGYAEYANGSFGLAVQSGLMMSWVSYDSARFVYQQVTGDFTFSARLVFSPNNMDYQSTAGLAVRADLTSGSVMDSVTACYRVDVQRGTRKTASSGFTATTIYDTDTWMRIVRNGFTVSCYTSFDGVNWNAVGSSTTVTSLPATAYLGLIVSSGQGSGGPMAYAQFDNVSIVSSAYPVVGAVASFTASPGSEVGAIALNWSAASGASTYQVERSTASNSGFVKIATVTDPTLTYVDRGLTIDTTYYYRLMAYNPGNNSGYASVTSTKPYMPSDISGWRYIYFGSTDDIEGYSGDLDIPAEDGITNLMKYALGLAVCDTNFNPIYTSPTSLPVVQQRVVGVDQYLTCTLTHNKKASDVTIMIEVTSDLNGTWTPLNPLDSANQVSVTDNMPSQGVETIVVKDTQPITSSNKRFMRMKVSH